MSVFFNSVFLFCLIFYSFLSQTVDEPIFVQSPTQQISQQTIEKSCNDFIVRSMSYFFILSLSIHADGQRLTFKYSTPVDTF